GRFGWAAAPPDVASAGAWRRSRAVTSAVQAPLSTKSRSGGPLLAGLPRCRPGNESLLEVTVELLAHVGGQGVEHAARGEQPVLLPRAGEGPDGGADRLRLRPAPRPRPRREPRELPLLEVHL